MAFYPCSNHHAPFRGPAHAAYPSLVNGASSDRKHLRMCLPCFEEYMGTLAGTLLEVDFSRSDTAELTATWPCSWCRNAAEWRIYVNAYPKGEPERLFYGAACEAHLSQARSTLLLS
jgi:hypothetical protein